MTKKQLLFLHAISKYPMGAEFTSASVADSPVWSNAGVNVERSLMSRISAQLMNGSTTWVSRTDNGLIYKRGSYFQHHYVLGRLIPEIHDEYQFQSKVGLNVSFLLGGKYAEMMCNKQANNFVTQLASHRFPKIFIDEEMGQDGCVSVCVPVPSNLSALNTFCAANGAIQTALDAYEVEKRISLTNV